MAVNNMTVIEGKHYRTGERVSLDIREGKIANVRLRHDHATHALPWVAPGLVDLQINGYGGRDFNTLPLTEQLVSDVARRLWREGVTSFFPTIITNSDESISSAMQTIARACAQHRDVARSVKGIHLEGPFISPEDGPRGAHSAEYVKAPDWELFQRWQEAAGGRIKIVTLSPEWPEACHFIEKCADSGVTVSIGHTAASAEQIREAVAAGATLSTHFGNGAHLMLPRHPNYLWEQLAQDELWTCVIADGFHLPESVLKTVLKVKKEQALLVSDAVSLSGLPPGEYETHVGGRVVLTPEGRLHTAADSRILAGSAQMLTWGVRHLVRSGLTDLAEAWEMGSVRPAHFMDLPSKRGLSPGAPADLVLFKFDEDEMTILQTIQAGKDVFTQFT